MDIPVVADNLSIPGTIGPLRVLFIELLPHFGKIRSRNNFDASLVTGLDNRSKRICMQIGRLSLKGQLGIIACDNASCIEEDNRSTKVLQILRILDRKSVV